MDILTFISTNPWQTFFLGPFILLLLVTGAWILGGITNFVFRLINRLLRTIKVCIRGWPPEHLDADGDFKPVPSCDGQEEAE